VKKKLKVLALFDAIRPTKLDQDFSKEMTTADWKTEKDVFAALGTLGHNAEHLAIFDNLDLLRQKLENFAPDVIFNLADQFKNNRGFDQNIVSLLEMQGVPFTGCGATGLLLCKHKGISKKILGYHHIHVPNFVVIPRGQRIARLKQPKFPLLVKPVKEEASYGISQASFVESDEQFKERVAFIHESHDADVIAEEYIEGREIYVGVIGNKKLQTFTPWEMVMSNLPDGAPNIATGKVKWDVDYQKKIGLVTKPAEIDEQRSKEFERLSKRVYRILGLTGYARIDYRLTEEGRIYLLEVNSNPQIAHHEDFADSAEHCGVSYEALLQKIVTLGMSYDPMS